LLTVVVPCVVEEDKTSGPLKSRMPFVPIRAFLITLFLTVSLKSASAILFLHSTAREGMTLILQQEIVGSLHVLEITLRISLKFRVGSLQYHSGDFNFISKFTDLLRN
jgi:hypothetical protein